MKKSEEFGVMLAGVLFALGVIIIVFGLMVMFWRI